MAYACLNHGNPYLNLPSFCCYVWPFSVIRHFERVHERHDTGRLACRAYIVVRPADKTESRNKRMMLCLLTLEKLKSIACYQDIATDRTLRA